MQNPTRMSHIYRLLLILAAALVLFLVVRQIVAPASWNYDLSHWYRLDSLEDMKKKPMSFGGIESVNKRKRNASCTSCHKKVVKAVRKKKHRQLSCEVCHGPRVDHVKDGKKFAQAKVDKTTWTCLNCHRPLINRPQGFPQYTTETNQKHRTRKKGTPCLTCHEAHDPTP